MKVILTIDVGSSSVRCLAYQLLLTEENEHDDENENENTSWPSYTLHALEDCTTQRQIRSVQPNTGHILLLQPQHEQQQTTLEKEVKDDDDDNNNNSSSSYNLFDVIDSCIDDTLHALRLRQAGMVRSSPDSSSGDNNDNDNEEEERRRRQQESSSFQVVGMGFSTFVMNLIGVDDRGHPVGRCATMSYACNTPEVAQECQSLKNELGRDRLQQLYLKTGTPLHGAYALAQLRVLYSSNIDDDDDSDTPPSKSRRVAEVVNKVVRWQTIASLCLARWQGGGGVSSSSPSFMPPISYSEASWTGLFNFRTCTWEDDALNLLPKQCQEAMPTLADYNDDNYHCTIPQFTNASSATTMSNPYWNRWPELRQQHCRLFLGVGDGACANIGSKCCTPRRIAVTVGTSAAARVCLALPMTSLTRTTTTTTDDDGTTTSSTAEDSGDKDDDDDGRLAVVVLPPLGLFCYRIDKSHVLVGGALTDGGSVVEWARSLMNLDAEEHFQMCMEQVQDLIRQDEMETTSCPTAALAVVPFLGGERSTGYRNGANGCVMGLTRETTSAHFMKACLEGVTLRIKAILELVCQAIGESAIQEATARPYVVVSGNAMEKNATWRQMLADASGMAVQFDSDSTEGTSRGVARLVASALLPVKRHGEESSDGFMHEEPIPSPITSHPRGHLHEGYWKEATEAQDSLIDAVCPLWKI